VPGPVPPSLPDKRAFILRHGEEEQLCIPERRNPAATKAHPSEMN